jgi:predicted 3-demethylubiquinone-9 3-methyltransferase (glyoxalase superfamily)
MNQNKIVPCLWFHTEGGFILPVIEYYKNIFKANFQDGVILPLGVTPSGNTEMSEVYIFGQKFIFLSTAIEHHKFNDALSLAIYCEDQNEIDKYWDYFSKDGEELQCGWCIDKYGLRWQILPKNMDELMSKPNSFEVMLNQKKIVIEEYLKSHF